MVELDPVLVSAIVILLFVCPIFILYFIYSNKTDINFVKPWQMENVKLCMVGAIIYVLLFANMHTLAELFTVKGHPAFIHCSFGWIATGCLLLIALMSLAYWAWVPPNTMQDTVCKSPILVLKCSAVLQIFLAIVGMVLGVIAVNAKAKSSK
jgi:hypothetical protein